MTMELISRFKYRNSGNPEHSRSNSPIKFCQYSKKHCFMVLLILILPSLFITPSFAVISKSSLNPDSKPHTTHLRNSEVNNFTKKYKYGQVIELPAEEVLSSPGGIHVQQNLHRHHNLQAKISYQKINQNYYHRALDPLKLKKDEAEIEHNSTLSTGSLSEINQNHTRTKSSSYLSPRKIHEANVEKNWRTRSPRSTMSNFTYQPRNYKCTPEVR